MGPKIKYALGEFWRRGCLRCEEGALAGREEGGREEEGNSGTERVLELRQFDELLSRHEDLGFCFVLAI